MPTANVVTVSSWFGPIRIIAGEDYVQHRPDRKVRGRRRYYRRLEHKANHFVVREDTWYDRMHWHADWPGMGNISWRERRSHLHAIFTMFRRLLAQTTEWTQPYQCWLQIDPADSSQDAVYLHTPSPNGSEFPIKFEWVQWNAEIPERLREFVTDPDWEFGRSDGQWTHFYVRRRTAP